MAASGQITKALDDKISDLKDRLTRIEGGKAGAGSMLGWIFGGIAAIVAITTLLIRFAG